MTRELALNNLRTMDDQIADNLSTESLIALLSAAFAMLAVLLAAIGLYGVLAYSTAQRTREIGIRMALGAQRSSVMRLVLVDVLWLAGISIAVSSAGISAAGAAVAQPAVWSEPQRSAYAAAGNFAGRRGGFSGRAYTGSARGIGGSDEGVAERVRKQQLAASEVPGLSLAYDDQPATRAASGCPDRLLTTDPARYADCNRSTLLFGRSPG